jgi:hypothetical protein
MKISSNTFPDQDSLFLIYSQKSCRFECALKAAITKVGCLPWDFPVPTRNGEAIEVDVCLSQQGNDRDKKLAEFHNEMKNSSNQQSCFCMPDCETVTYDVQVDNVPLPPPKELCTDIDQELT